MLQNRQRNIGEKKNDGSEMIMNENGGDMKKENFMMRNENIELLKDG
jgi:hypothetical protein